MRRGPVFRLPTKVMTEPKKGDGIYFEGIYGQNKKPYPAWRYHKFLEPKIVNNADEDEQARLAGWDTPDVPITAIARLANFNHDLEDMNAAQLVLFAKEEYDADLPMEAGEEKLLKAIWRLARIAPENEGRMILLAQSIEMNYDETLKEIERLAGDDADLDYSETTEVWL